MARRKTTEEGENFMTLYCVYRENLIDKNAVYHYRQFKETINGDRLPIFKDNKAVIFMDLNGRYRVEALDGEVVFIGTGGIDEALGRIDYAQPFVDVQINEGSRTYSRQDYYRHISPVVWFIAQFYDEDTDKLAIAYERRKNGRLLDEGTVIFTGDEPFAWWLVDKLSAEERPPVVEFGDWVTAIVRDKLTEVELNDDYLVEIKRGTWPSLRKKAQEAVSKDGK